MVAKDGTYYLREIVNGHQVNPGGCKFELSFAVHSSPFCYPKSKHKHEIRLVTSLFSDQESI